MDCKLTTVTFWASLVPEADLGSFRIGSAADPNSVAVLAVQRPVTDRHQRVPRTVRGRGREILHSDWWILVGDTGFGQISLVCQIKKNSEGQWEAILLAPS